MLREYFIVTLWVKSNNDSEQRVARTFFRHTAQDRWFGIKYEYLKSCYSCTDAIYCVSTTKYLKYGKLFQTRIGIRR